MEKREEKWIGYQTTKGRQEEGIAQENYYRYMYLEESRPEEQ